MSWDRPPSTTLAATGVEAAAGNAMRQVGDELVAALAAGTPVRTGALRASWSAEPVDGGVRVEADASYARHVDIDTTAAETVLARADERVAAAINAAIFGGS